MLAKLFPLIGIDYRQWKAVSRTLLRADFRPMMTPQSIETYSLNSVGGVLKMALTFGIFSLAQAPLDLVYVGYALVAVFAAVWTCALVSSRLRST